MLTQEINSVTREKKSVHTGKKLALANLIGIQYNTSMKEFKIVLDTNVIVSALKSQKGASFKLLTLFNSGAFKLCMSVAMVLEYEEILKKTRDSQRFSERDIDDLLEYICSISQKVEIHYLWRPTLRDPDDEMVLELAVAAQADYIITFNVKDFISGNFFGVKIITPSQFLKIIER